MSRSWSRTPPPAAEPASPDEGNRPPAKPDWPFYLCFGILGSVYVVLLLALLLADIFFTQPGALMKSQRSMTWSQ